jgi:hypothetical protein
MCEKDQSERNVLLNYRTLFLPRFSLLPQYYDGSGFICGRCVSNCRMVEVDQIWYVAVRIEVDQMMVAKGVP